MTEEEKDLAAIEKMTHYEVCYLWRFGPIGHRYMNSETEVGKAFKAKFDSYGGFTTSISKQLGWD